MNKKELISAIANRYGIKKVDVDLTLDALSDIVKAELLTQGAITLPGIGHLTVKQTAQREGRNPATGEAITIPAKKRIKLTAVKALKSAVN